MSSNLGTDTCVGKVSEKHCCSYIQYSLGNTRLADLTVTIQNSMVLGKCDSVMTVL